MGRLMARPPRIYLDANFFIAMLEPSDTALAAQLTRLYTLKGGGAEALMATSEMTLAELLVTPYKNNDAALIRTYETLFASGGALETAAVDRNVLRQAARLRSRRPQIKLPDAIHLATAEYLACSHFLTFDLRISLAEADDPVQMKILAPTLESLGELIEEFVQ